MNCDVIGLFRTPYASEEACRPERELSHLHLDGIRDKALAALERIREIRQTMVAAVEQSPGFGQIVRCPRGADAAFLIFQECGQELRGDRGIVREIRVVNELGPQAQARLKNSCNLRGQSIERSHAL